MLSRIARVGIVALCATGLIGMLSEGTAAARGPLARKSVIGGTAASLQDWGFTAAVLTPTSLCTGTVLSPIKVLTTAHCVGDPATMVVRTNSTSAFSGGEASAVAAAAINPGWTHSFEGDVAVITLQTPTTAPPIQLASAAEDATYTQPGAPLSVAGFGNRNPLIVGKQQIGLLTATDVSARVCGLPSWAICDAGTRVGTAFRRLKHRVRKHKVVRTICSGDSGGPLVARTPQGARLIGIAEASSSPPKRNPFFFVLCGLKGYPSLHTRVSSYLSFIQGNLGP